MFCLYALYAGLAEGAERALIPDLVPASSRATAYGAFQLVTGIGTLLATLACGAIWARSGSGAALGTAAACAALATIGLALMPLSRGRI